MMLRVLAVSLAALVVSSDASARPPIAPVPAFAAMGALTGQLELSPKTIFGTSLAAWYCPYLGVVLTSGLVSQWQDQSGNGQNVSQSTGTKQFTYVTSGPRAPYLSQPAGGGLNALSGGSFSLTAPYEIYLVASWFGTLPSSGVQSYYFGVDFSPGLYASVYQPGATSNMGIASSSTGPQVAIPAANTLFVVDAIFNGSSSKISINGGSYTTGNPGTNHPASAPISIGSYYPQTEDGWWGNIWEVVVLNTAATAQQETNWQRYASLRYGQP
jgi:hypothetical protein